MAFNGRKIEILPWAVVFFVGAVLGRNICHHAGWPWWVGFTVIPFLFVLAGLLLNALFRKTYGRFSRRKRDTQTRGKPRRRS